LGKKAYTVERGKKKKKEKTVDAKVKIASNFYVLES